MIKIDNNTMYKGTKVNQYLNQREKEILEIINKFKWRLKDINNKEIEQAIHYSGNEVFMEIHNEDLNNLKQKIKGEEK